MNPRDSDSSPSSTPSGEEKKTKLEAAMQHPGVAVYEEVFGKKDAVTAAAHVRQKLRELLRVARCPEPHCNGDGRITEPLGEHFVTHEMAMDAGEPSMEGRSMGVEWGVRQCQWCDERKTLLLSLDSNDAGADQVNKAPLSHGSLTGWNTSPAPSGKELLPCPHCGNPPRVRNGLLDCPTCEYPFIGKPGVPLSVMIAKWQLRPAHSGITLEEKKWTTHNPRGPYVSGGVWRKEKLLCVCENQFQAVEIVAAHNQTLEQTKEVGEKEKLEAAMQHPGVAEYEAVFGIKEAVADNVNTVLQMEREALFNEITEEWSWKSYPADQPLWSWIRRRNGEYIQQLPTTLAEDVCRKQSAAIVRAVDLAIKRFLSENSNAVLPHPLSKTPASLEQTEALAEKGLLAWIYANGKGREVFPTQNNGTLSPQFELLARLVREQTEARPETASGERALLKEAFGLLSLPSMASDDECIDLASRISTQLWPCRSSLPPTGEQEEEKMEKDLGLPGGV